MDRNLDLHQFNADTGQIARDETGTDGALNVQQQLLQVAVHQLTADSHASP